MEWGLCGHVMLLLSLKACGALVLSHLINWFKLFLLDFLLLLLHQSMVIRRSCRSNCETCMLLLLRDLWFYQIHLGAKLCRLFERTILIGSTDVFVRVDVLEFRLLHQYLLHLLSFIFAWHGAWALLRLMLFNSMLWRNNITYLICIATRRHNVTSLWA